MVRIISVAGLAIAAAGTLLVSDDCRAAITVLGPTPYYSKADSPFPVDGSNPNFFLEDFEPPANLPPSDLIVGEFSSFGATREIGGIQAGTSIGEDDRIDGSGRNGWCGSLNTRVIRGTEAQLNMFGVDFNAEMLGFFPTAVGFVVTHGVSHYSSFSVYNPDGARKDLSLRGLNTNTASQGGGQFVGITDSEGISRIEILQTIIYGETTADEILLFDHFQYGLSVPEPIGAELIWSFSAIGVATLFWRHLRPLNILF